MVILTLTATNLAFSVSIKVNMPKGIQTQTTEQGLLADHKNPYFILMSVCLICVINIRQKIFCAKCFLLLGIGHY